jgi:hypothetical protein
MEIVLFWVLERHFLPWKGEGQVYFVSILFLCRMIMLTAVNFISKCRPEPYSVNGEESDY